jgi:hypothetical protein
MLLTGTLIESFLFNLSFNENSDENESLRQKNSENDQFGC